MNQDPTAIVLQSISEDIAQLNARLEFHESLIMQVIEALVSAGLVNVQEGPPPENTKEESLIVEP